MRVPRIRRLRPDGLRLFAAVSIVPTILIQPFGVIAEAELRRCPRAAGVLPLGLRGQTATSPLAKGERFRPTHAVHWLFRLVETAVVPGGGLCDFTTGSIHEPAVLCVRHRILAEHEVLRDADKVNWLFPFELAVRSHLKFTGRNAHQRNPGTRVRNNAVIFPFRNWPDVAMGQDLLSEAARFLVFRCGQTPADGLQLGHLCGAVPQEPQDGRDAFIVDATRFGRLRPLLLQDFNKGSGHEVEGFGQTSFRQVGMIFRNACRQHLAEERLPERP